MKKSTIIASLKILGGIIIFSSWILDNYFNKALDGQRMQCEDLLDMYYQRKSEIEVFEIAADRSLDDYLSESKTEGKEHFIQYYTTITSKKLQASETLGLINIFLDAENIDTTKNREEIAKRHNARTKELSDKSDFLGMVKYQKYISDSLDIVDKSRLGAAQKAYFNLFVKLELFNYWFLRTYIIGSILIGIAFLLDLRKKSS